MLSSFSLPLSQQKKKKQQSPRKHASDVQSERRNPSRKARPPEHFGLEQEPVVTAKARKKVQFDLQKLMEVKRKQLNTVYLQYITVVTTTIQMHSLQSNRSSIFNTQIDEELRVNRDTPRRKCRKRTSIRMPEDITEEELDNVADRAKDKILDKENVSWNK